MPVCWTRLEGAIETRFCLERAAVIEHVRASLPTHLSRRVASNPAYPAQIWRGDDGLLAFVWELALRAGSGNPPETVIGFARQSEAHGHRVQFVTLAEARQLIETGQGNGLAVEASVQPVDFHSPFWTSDRQETGVPAVAEAAGPPGEEPQRDRSVKQAQAVERIRRAQRGIDEALPVAEGDESAPHPPEGHVCVAAESAVAAEWRQAGAATREEVAKALKRAGVCNFWLEESDPRIVLMERTLPFYTAGTRLFRVIDLRGPRSRFASFVLSGQGDFASLYKLSRPIHEFNKRRLDAGELRIDHHTVAAYLRFFGEFVQGEAGAFSIIEHPDDVRWLAVAHENGTDDANALRAAHDSCFERVHIYVPKGVQPTEEAAAPIFCRAVVGYGRCVFIAGFAVSPNGGVNMFDDEMTHDGELPIRPLSFNPEFQFELRVDASAAGGADRRRGDGED